MMRDILASHPEVWMAGETHYLDDLRVRMRGYEQRPLGPEQQRVCEDYFLALLDRPYGRGGDPERRADRLTRDELRAAAAEVGHGSDAYFVGFCQALSRKDGKIRWGEKTPRHVFRIDDIFGLWPDARVICMVRDPRAVVSSYRWWKRTDRPRRAGVVRDEAWVADDRRARRSYNPFTISMLWRAAMRASLTAVEKHGSARVRLQRYEDVVGEPEQELRGLVGWLELDFDDALLDVAVSNSSFFVPGERGISTEPLERWKTNLPPDEISVIQTCCGGLMRSLGYPPVKSSASPLRVAVAWATVPVALVRAFVVNRHRLGNSLDYVVRRMRLVTNRG
jgi:hypothetical protein